MLIGGIDVGTSGVKIIICDELGKIISSITQDFTFPQISLPDGYFEQDPKIWWKVVKSALKLILKDLQKKNISASDIKAISVDSTSGTIFPINNKLEPLHNALMYNDSRSIKEAREINELTQNFYLKFKSSFALSKILWILRNKPQIFKSTYKFVHAVDFITGHLTGNYSYSDSSNTLKTGFDIINKRWPPFIEELGINLDLLPKVIPPGEKIGNISEECAKETGLNTSTNVVAGATDGTAGVIASGAVNHGDIFNIIGTTLVERVVTKNIILDEKGRVYCHLLPTGFLPGGASNVGAECLNKYFPNEDLKEMDKKTVNYKPSNLIIYPLARMGERFPFINSSANHFIVGQPKNKFHLYTGYLEAVAYVEKWILEIFEELGANPGNTVYSTGGGAYSKEWCQIRADILNKKIRRPEVVESAMGCAILAATFVYYKDLVKATKNMVHIKDEFQPNSEMNKKYEKIYLKFRDECNKRGYK